MALQLTVIGLAFLSLAVGLDEPLKTAFGEIIMQQGGLLTALMLLLAFAIAAGLSVLFAAYPRALERLAEETILLASHRGHRVLPQGAREVRLLADKLNAFASVHDALHDEVQAKIDGAARALAEERNRLAALMAELSMSVLVCNLQGRILLYNAGARQLFDAMHADTSMPTLVGVGLGRSVFGIIDRSLIEHALEQIRHQLDQGEDQRARHPIAVFVMSTTDGRILRTRMAPVLNDAQELDGFVLTLEDVSQYIEAESRRAILMQTLTQQVRAAVANIRAAVEMVQAFPDMSSTKRGQFEVVIDTESLRLARDIERAVRAQDAVPESQWQLEDIHASDWLLLLARRMESAAIKTSVAATADARLWLKVDSFALTQALVWLSQRLAMELGVQEIRLGLQRAGHLAYLDLIWSNAPLAADSLHAWEHTPLYISVSAPTLTLADIVQRHGAESVYRSEGAGQVSCYRLLMPPADKETDIVEPPRVAERPHFYDFDLFHQAGQSAELDDCLLTQLIYTVFDTETSGLRPAEGDEIISIGAVRIVNGRLLQQEVFDQLARPRQYLSAESISIHGITDAMLIGQPTIETVLPRFYRFAEETVLVAHNAAFDMRFLQLQGDRINVHFTQPVLDTLLLSQVIHPHQENHSLEAIAARLGVAVVDRHSALGDALTTGGVFLRMLPLLREKGIHTLRQGREAAQKALYADIRY